MDSSSSDHSTSPCGGPLRSVEALSLVQAVVNQLRASRRCLEAESGPSQGNEDALIYLITAEMHVQAARRRLEGA